jgi:hypothetical protein
MNTAAVLRTPPASTNPTIDEEVMLWQGRIAVAAKQGNGLSIFRAALDWVKHEAWPQEGLRQRAKQELLGAAERHLVAVNASVVTLTLVSPERLFREFRWRILSR